MSCERFGPMMTAYLDGELTRDQRQEIEEHLAVCENCKSELGKLAALKEDLAMIQFKEPSDVELERYWACVYNRLERGLGWVCLSAGAIIVLCYGGFKLIEQLIKDPNIALLLKIGVIALVCGVVILFVSLLRERLTLRKVDKYSKEVKR